jgi:restriction endonuclease S subunit
MQYAVGMHKETYLKDIAEVITGYTFRTALQGKDNASLFVLQAKNISDNSIVDEDGLDGIDFENYWSKAIVKKGDVVISSKGSFRAGVINLGLKNTIAASSVYILRPSSGNVIPEYLAIFFNSQKGQKQISEKATGAVINTILRKDLENIAVSLPDLETQKKIVKLYHAGKELQEALTKKMKLVSSINEGAINKLLNS